MELLLIEQNGLETSFPIDKGVTRVGSASNCHVKLPAKIGAPLQLQVFYALQQPDRCKVQNIGPEIWVKCQGSRQKLATSTSLEMRSGDELFIDTCKLIFTLSSSSGVMRTSSSFDASLSFPHPVLYPDIPNVGTLTIRNTGKSASCQFQVRVNGLPGDCFQIDPAPLLHPGAQEHFLIHLFHRERYPRAGFHEIKLIISASNTYPGEEVMICQQIYVMPFSQTEIELQDDLPVRDIVTEKHPIASFSPSDSGTPAASIAAVGAVIEMKPLPEIEGHQTEKYPTASFPSSDSGTPAASIAAVDAVIKMKPLPKTKGHQVVRTDFSDQSVWEMICRAVRKSYGKHSVSVEFIDDIAYEGMTKEHILSLGSKDYHHSFIILADQIAVSMPDFPLLVVDLYDEPGREFRAIPSQIRVIETNLTLANMSFYEFADEIDQDGVFRGFPIPWFIKWLI